MIRFCVNGYNEIYLIESCLKRIKPFADHITFVDGAYKEFPHDKPWSTDGTLDIARIFCDEVIETKDAWKDEIVKRNQYLNGEDGDWYVVIDCDEMLIGDINKQRLVKMDTDDVDITMVERDANNKRIPDRNIYRLFKHREGIHYAKTHHALWIPGVDQPLNKRKHDIYSDAFLKHLTKERPHDRNVKKGKYIRWLQKEERAARHEYYL